MKSVCYVVPFARTSLAKNIFSKISVLKSSDYLVSVICYDGSGADLFVNRCNEIGVNVSRISTNDLNLNLSIQNIPFLVSYRVREILLKEKYDIVRFVDYMGSGFHCIQAKRTLGEFADTLFAVDMYGSSQFKNEAGEEWGYGGFEQLMVQYMERYICEFCDTLTSPTEYMFDWVISKRWNICKNHCVVPNVFNADTGFLKNPDSSSLIFCGEYSKAGGLHLFCNALQRLPEEALRKVKQITFIGEMNNVGNVHAEKYINDIMNSIGVQYSILNSIEPKDIILECEKNNAILVFPQIMSNNDIEIVSAASCNIPVIATNSSSHFEILDERVMFNSSPTSLASKIQDIEKIDFSQISHKYNGNAAKEKWIEVNSISTPNTNKAGSYKPLVSICIAYYNHGKFLDMALSSIERMDYKNLEVIIVNDGSTDMNSIEIFNQMKNKYQGKKYRFVDKNNEGPSITRNHAADIATGEHLIFMDSDNIAKPNMVDDFVEGIQRSGCDCLTCYFDQFLGEGNVNSRSINGITYTLLGPSLELGVFLNCFGDTNFIIKREIFLKLGGFYKNRVVTEDWQFLSNLALNGFKLDVIPSSLFWYRVLPESNVSFGSEYFKQQIILDTYCNNLPPYVYHVFNSLCRPTLEPNKLSNMPEVTSGILKKLLEITNRLLPVNTKRRKLIKKIIVTIFGRQKQN